MQHPHRRVRVLLVGALIIFTLFGGQLVRLQGIEASGLSESGVKFRQYSMAKVPAERGQIVSADGVVLAADERRYNVAVDQTAVPFYSRGGERVGVAGAAADLSPLLGIPPERLVPLMTGAQRFAYLAKDVSPLIWREISRLGINGVSREIATRRVYPVGSTASALVGWVGNGNVAVKENGGGLELQYNSVLSGTVGTTEYEFSRDGREIPGTNTSVPPVPGLTTLLTVDADLQWYAQNAVAQRVNETHAQSGAIVVMDVRTGALKAVATYPTFDPSDIGRTTSYLGNRAFGEAFEPGSIAKVMTAAAALEEGVADPRTEVTVPNRLPRADKVFQDSHDHPTEHLTFAGVLAQSSNIGTILVGEKVRPSILEGYFRKFGVGVPTGVAFPGETQGLFAHHRDWNDSQRYTVMYGQGLSMTAVQAAGVFQTIANGGLRVPPTLVSGTRDASGAVTPAPAVTPVRVVSDRTARTLTQMLEFVVGDEGTAKQAEVEGYRVAGKTGTADRVGASGRYTGKTAAFVGFAPADDPRYVVAVILQDPVKGYWGGATAGPVFKDVMTYTLQRFGVPPTGTQPPVMQLKVGEEPVSAGSVQKITRLKPTR